jgi:hypothetical protein
VPSADHQQYHNWSSEQTEAVGLKGDAGWERAREEETAGLKDDAGLKRACEEETVGRKDDAG